MAIEEARELPARLLVYRRSATREVYDTSGMDVDVLRPTTKAGLWSPLLRRATMLFNSDRGEDSTVDLDLIAKAAGRVSGQVLYHDQFSGLTGFLRKSLHGDEYALFVHETALGDRRGVMDLTLRRPWLGIPLRAYDVRIIRGARVLFTNSRANQQLLSRYGLRSTVAYPGCTPVSAGGSERDRFVLAVALWERTKMPETYLEVARRSRVKVVLAGMWGRREEMEAFRIRSAGLVEVTGPLSERDLDRLSRRASLYMRFGFGERGPGQGGIQAMSYGLPVVANSSLAVSELIVNGENGWVVEEVGQAADLIRDVIDDPRRLSAMSDAARLTAQQLTWTAHSNVIREGLRQLN